MEEYFCDHCLYYWQEKSSFMPGCGTCHQMKNSSEWGKDEAERAANAAIVWGPIIDYCNKNNMKAFVVPGNHYSKRLPFDPSVTISVPFGDEYFFKHQRMFVRMYNNEKTEANWNLLHPSTQRMTQLRF